MPGDLQSTFEAKSMLGEGKKKKGINRALKVENKIYERKEGIAINIRSKIDAWLAQKKKGIHRILKIEN